MSKQDTEIQGTKTATEVEDPQRRELLTRATKLAVYTAPVLFTLSHPALGSSKPEKSAPGRTQPGKNAPGRTPGNHTMSFVPPDPPAS